MQDVDPMKKVLCTIIDTFRNENEMNESDFIINTPYDLTYEDIEAIQKRVMEFLIKTSGISHACVFQRSHKRLLSISTEFQVCLL